MTAEAATSNGGGGGGRGEEGEAAAVLAARRRRGLTVARVRAGLERRRDDVDLVHGGRKRAAAATERNHGRQLAKGLEMGRVERFSGRERLTLARERRG